MTDLKELREMAEKAFPEIVTLQHGGFDVEKTYAAIRAVLAFTEPEKPKEPMKVSGWAIIDPKGQIRGGHRSYMEAQWLANYYSEIVSKFGRCSVVYVTGTEGVGPDDATHADKAPPYIVAQMPGMMQYEGGLPSGAQYANPSLASGHAWFNKKTPPPEQKQEKPREWWVIVDKDGVTAGVFDDYSKAKKAVIYWDANKPNKLHRVREVMEGE